MRTKAILAAVVVTFVTVAPLGSVQQAAAQAEPPPPPGNEPPPGYTPPPPPPGYAGGNAPNYAPPPPSGPPSRVQAQGGAEVRYEPEEPDLELLSESGAVPVERFHPYRHGWWGGYRYGVGWAPMYSPVCDQACVTRLAPGPYQLALSKNGGPAIPAYGPAVLNGPSLIRASYSDRSGLRVAGWVIGVTGLVGGIVMIAASASDEDVCDPDGLCHRHETANAPLLVGGIGVLLASGIVGGILASQRDEAHVSIEPLRLSSFGRLRESLAAMGAETHPEGAALALHF
jgi:hypothetical protein